MSINKYDEKWLDVLNLQLSDLRQRFPDAHIYALVEGVLNESCYPLLKRSANLAHTALYADLPGADTETLCMSPLLVEYAEIAQRTWDALLKKTDGQPALSLIVTPESLVQLSARLAPWCVVDADDYTVGLSFADTRILPELFNILTPQQLGQFCGPALLWQYVTRYAEWAQLSLPSKALDSADEVSFTEPQCNALMDAAEADNILLQLRTVSPSLLQQLTPADAHASIEYWLRCASHAKIDSAPERVRLCEFGLQNPHLAHSPSLVSWKAMPGKTQSMELLCQQWAFNAAT